MNGLVYSSTSDCDTKWILTSNTNRPAADIERPAKGKAAKSFNCGGLAGQAPYKRQIKQTERHAITPTGNHCSADSCSGVAGSSAR